MSRHHDQKFALLRSLDSVLENILPDRLLKLTRFGLSGIMATILYFLLVNVFVLLFNILPIQASLYSYLLSLIFSYIAQSRFTFRSFKDKPAKIARFIIAALLGLFIAHFGMKYVTEGLKLHYLYGAVLICAIIPIINFLIMNYWIFTDQGAYSEEEDNRY